MNIILIGPPKCGKSAVGLALSKHCGKAFLDTDRAIEALHRNSKNEFLNVREICIQYGLSYFRDLEKKVVNQIKLESSMVIATGGGTILDDENLNFLRTLGPCFFLNVNKEILVQRMLQDMPSYVDRDNPIGSFLSLLQLRAPLYEILATKIIHCENLSPTEISLKILGFCNGEQFIWKNF